MWRRFGGIGCLSDRRLGEGRRRACHEQGSDQKPLTKMQHDFLLDKARQLSRVPVWSDFDA